MKPALEQAAFRAGADGCSGDPVKDDHGAFARWQYLCPSGRAVELYLVGENGHAWPGGQQGSWIGDKPASTLNGTDIIRDFFKAHAK